MVNIGQKAKGKVRMMFLDFKKQQHRSADVIKS